MLGCVWGPLVCEGAGFFLQADMDEAAIRPIAGGRAAALGLTVLRVGCVPCSRALQPCPAAACVRGRAVRSRVGRDETSMSSLESNQAAMSTFVVAV